jgi:DNA polymerase elongation subunit (family B)
MIEAWSKWVREVNPDIITGHNIVAYDLPYLQFLCDRNNCSMGLGRDGSPIKFDSYQSRFRKDQTQFIEYYRPRVYGREIIDTLFLAIKYDNVAKKYESYNLKKIIEAEGLTQEGRVFYDAGHIKNNYKDKVEWKKIKLYAEFDGDDALALYNLFIPPYFYMTQSVPKSFQAMIESATGSQINSMMVRSYLQEGHSIAKATDVEHFEGAISFGNAGIFKNVVKVDISSLYPSIMREYKIYDKDKDPNGNFLKIVDTLTLERLKNKKLAKTDKHYDDLQSSQKIAINSCYGFMGASGLNYNSIRNAEMVTSKGREILQHSIKWAEDKGYRIVNADTDSISYNKPDGSLFSEQYMLSDLNELNATLPELIKFEPDGYFTSLIVFKAKNYVMYDGKKIKKKGSALKSSSKEIALKKFSDEMIDALIFDKTNYTEIYNKYIIQAMSLTSENIKEWSSKKTISRKVMTNERTNEAKLRDAIEGEEIVEGDKVYVYFKSDSSLALCDNFDGDYDKEKMLEKLYNSTKLFSTVIDTSCLINYSLKRNQEALHNLLGIPYEAPKRKSKKKSEQMELSIENSGS